MGEREKLIIELNALHIDKEVTFDIAYYSKRLNEFYQIYPRVINNFFEKINKGQTLEDKEKITIEEYAILHDIAFLKKHFDVFDKKNLLTGNVFLSELQKKINRCHEIVLYFEPSLGKNWIIKEGFFAKQKSTVISGEEFAKRLSQFVMLPHTLKPSSTFKP